MPKPYAQLRAQMSPDAQRRAQTKARLAEDGWALWADESPYDYTQVELMRRNGQPRSGAIPGPCTH